MNNDCMIDFPHFLQGTRHEWQEFRMKDSNHCPLRTSSIGHWTQNIKAGSHPQLFSNGRHKLHGGMIDGSKHEGDSTLIHTL